MLKFQAELKRRKKLEMVKKASEILPQRHNSETTKQVVKQDDWSSIGPNFNASSMPQRFFVLILRRQRSLSRTKWNLS
jgi:hypothetical protein